MEILESIDKLMKIGSSEVLSEATVLQNLVQVIAR